VISQRPHRWPSAQPALMRQHQQQLVFLSAPVVFPGHRYRFAHTTAREGAKLLKQIEAARTVFGGRKNEGKRR
jgi:hypothetical protein